MKITITIDFDGMSTEELVAFKEAWNQPGVLVYKSNITDTKNPLGETKSIYNDHFHPPKEVVKDRLAHTFKENPERPAVETVFPKHDLEQLKKGEQPKRHGNGSVNGKRGPYKKHKDFNAPHKEYKKRIPKSTVKTNMPFIGEKKEKRGRKPLPVPETPPAVYLSFNAIEALKSGKEPMALPGVQATKGKFIVANAYIHGRLEDARDQYMKYFENATKDNGYDILTWHSWLCRKYIQKTDN